MSASGEQGEKGKQLQVTVDSNTDYKYRDLFNIHVGAEDVVIEFGNLHRGAPSPSATIHDRLVLSPGNAMRLQQALAKAIGQMQEKLREAANKQGNQN